VDYLSVTMVMMNHFNMSCEICVMACCKHLY